MTTTAKAAPKTIPHGTPALSATITKIIMLAILDALGVYTVFVLIMQGKWVAAVGIAAAVIALNVLYFKRGWLPAKYLVPGFLFLLVFQVFVIGYTGYISLTNYSTGHISTKDRAISTLLSFGQERVADSEAYPVTIIEDGAQLGMLVENSSGVQLAGFPDEPLTEVQGDEDFVELTFAQILQRQSELTNLSVPVSDDPGDGTLRTRDGRTAYQYLSNLEYDEALDVMRERESGKEYSDRGSGAFIADDGTKLLPGWQIYVGSDNYLKAFTDSDVRGPLIKVLLWTIAFALLSVLSTFVLGLGLALVLSRESMRGRVVYRALLILPYAFPAFLSAMVWSGMLNSRFGFINQVLLGGANIPWMTDPWLAKVSVLMVNLWLGFPYMFLVCLGALQSIPSEVTEAGRVDGASPWQILSRIKLPLLMVSVAPLLISSFAFNFNNFNLIYMLTGGGPRDISAAVPVGETDILISMVYKIAFTGQNRDYGLASAFSIIIFLIVTVIAVVSFRRTKALEGVN